MPILAHNRYGKSRVRLAKVDRERAEHERKGEEERKKLHEPGFRRAR